MAKWEQLVVARERKHLSQAEAAERINVGLVTYQRWELGKRKPQPQHMRHLCELFESLLEQHERVASQETFSDWSLSTPFTENSREETPVVLLVEETDKPQTFITAHMTTHLWSLAFKDHPTCNNKRSSIRQAIKDFDSMNTQNKNYQITRREALCSLATLPMITLGLTTPGKIIPSAQYGNALAQCTASVEACWELYQSGNSHDLSLAFETTSTYLSVLQTIIKNSPHYRKEALDLAARYALLKTVLGWHCANPTVAVQYARDAVAFSQETSDVSLQLSAYNKLAWAYFYDKKYAPALTTAQEAEALLLQSHRLSHTEPVRPCIRGGIYSTLSLMQVKNGKSPDTAIGKATEADPGDEVHAFLDFTNSTMLLEAGWVYYYSGNQPKVMEILSKRIDSETLIPKIIQSEMGRIETINIMARSSLKTPNRDREKTIHFWTTAMEGARALRSDFYFQEALATYELLEVVWPGEQRIADLRDHIMHWEE